MKQQLLVGGLLLSFGFANAQDQISVNPQNQTGTSQNELKIRTISPRAKAVKRAGISVFNQNTKMFPATEANSSLLASGTWSNISTSMNIYGVFNSNSRPLQYNPNVNAISFVHRKSAYFTAAPADNSGAIVAMISTNWGSGWDSTCFYSDATYPGRYPQGAIYSAPGNTNIANAYIVGSGPCLGGAGWGGSFFASKQLGSGNYTQGASTTPNAMQVLTNFPPYPAMGRFDYASYGFTSTDDGVVRSLGVICDDFNNLNDVWGYMLVKGTFNAGIFNWTGDSINPPVVTRTDGTHHMNFTPMTAWSQNGVIGYVVTIGARQGATGANVGYQPIVYKTTNSGASWSLLNGIDFNAPQYAPILQKLAPVSGTLSVPYFWANEGIDAVVDANGKLHIVSTIVNTPSTHQDSLDSYEVYDTEEYHWPHTAGKRPYIYDFIGDGSGPWTFVTVDSLTSEGPPSDAGVPGYNENPWDDDGGFKPRSDSRIQLSRTPDGKFIFYTWAESNPNFTAGGKNWNNIPDIKVRAMDVTGIVYGPYNVSSNEIEASKLGNNTNIISKAMFHFSSPVASSYTMAGTTMSVTLPLSVTNSNPYSQLTDNTHWYCSATLNFSFPVSTGIYEQKNGPGVLNVYPNPANSEAAIGINIVKNSKINVSIVNSLGQVVNNFAAEAVSGENKLNLEISGLNAGVYFVNVNVDGVVKTAKLIKQ